MRGGSLKREFDSSHLDQHRHFENLMKKSIAILLGFSSLPYLIMASYFLFAYIRFLGEGSVEMLGTSGNYCYEESCSRITEFLKAFFMPILPLFLYGAWIIFLVVGVNRRWPWAAWAAIISLLLPLLLLITSAATAPSSDIYGPQIAASVVLLFLVVANISLLPPLFLEARHMIDQPSPLVKRVLKPWLFLASFLLLLVVILLLIITIFSEL